MSSGGLSLWKFVGRSVVLGVSLPSVSLDSSVLCGGDFQVQIQDVLTAMLVCTEDEDLWCTGRDLLRYSYNTWICPVLGELKHGTAPVAKL